MRRRKLLTAHEYHLFGCAAVCALSAVFFGLAILIGAWKMRDSWSPDSDPIAAAQSRRGRQLVARYGCPSCHVIPDASPEGMVGPPLTNIGRQSYIAGYLPNEQIWMSLWLQNPQRWKPGTAMPNLNVTDRDARDMAAYLATLR